MFPSNQLAPYILHPGKKSPVWTGKSSEPSFIFWVRHVNFQGISGEIKILFYTLPIQTPRTPFIHSFRIFHQLEFCQGFSLVDIPGETQVARIFSFQIGPPRWMIIPVSVVRISPIYKPSMAIWKIKKGVPQPDPIGEVPMITKVISWLVVSTHLKNIN